MRTGSEGFTPALGKRELSSKPPLSEGGAARDQRPVRRRPAAAPTSLTQLPQECVWSAGGWPLNRSHPDPLTNQVTQQRGAEAADGTNAASQLALK